MTNPRPRTGSEELAAGCVSSAAPGEQRVIPPVGNHLGLAPRGGQTHPAELSVGGKQSGRSNQSWTPAGITGWHLDMAMDRLGTTAGNSVNICGIKFVRPNLIWPTRNCKSS